MREKHRLRVFKNKVMRIFGPKREEVKRQWRRLHDQYLDDMNSSPNTFGDQINKNEMSRTCIMYRAQDNII